MTEMCWCAAVKKPSKLFFLLNRQSDGLWPIFLQIGQRGYFYFALQFLFWSDIFRVYFCHLFMKMAFDAPFVASFFRVSLSSDFCTDSAWRGELITRLYMINMIESWYGCITISMWSSFVTVVKNSFRCLWTFSERFLKSEIRFKSEAFHAGPWVYYISQSLHQI